MDEPRPRKTTTRGCNAGFNARMHTRAVQKWNEDRPPPSSDASGRRELWGCGRQWRRRRALARRECALWLDRGRAQLHPTALPATKEETGRERACCCHPPPSNAPRTHAHAQQQRAQKHKGTSGGAAAGRGSERGGGTAAASRPRCGTVQGGSIAAARFRYLR